jgi:small subunit ribosomal protein S7
MSILVFNRWDMSAVKVEDKGLQRYISIAPKYVPRTGARYAGFRFHKSKVSIVERFVNKVMIPGHKSKKHWRSSGHCTGKGENAYRAVEEAFKIIEQKTKKNPIEVYVKAVENGAPREEIITIEYGGARYPKAVECAPQRRIDIALRYMVQGAYGKCFNTKKKLAQALADEVINAANLSQQSMAISKKLEVERQADSSR